MLRTMNGNMTYMVGIAAASGVFSLAAYFFLFQQHTPSIQNTDSSALAFPRDTASVSDLSTFEGTSSPLRTALAGTEEYRNIHYGFSFFYPKGLKVSTFDEGGGASTVTFQDTTEVKGFQVFIVPYQGEQVSMTRFRSDEPSGVMEQMKNILVGGTKATMFFSTNAMLGDTIEVWVIKNGYLFEITAPKSLDVWLATTMQTWKFL